MQPDIYVVPKKGGTIGWDATEEAAKKKAKATGGGGNPAQHRGK